MRHRMALVAEPLHTAPKVPFDDAVNRMDWRQGEHITLIGPTGRGKTELLVKLIERHPWVLFLGTKQHDATQRRLVDRHDFREIRDPAALNPEVGRRFVFRPAFPKASAGDLKTAHRQEFRAVMMAAYRQTGWTVAVDEARYIAHFLGLTDEYLLLLLQGRSQGNTVISGTQRPRFVPLEVYDQATHLF